MQETDEYYDRSLQASIGYNSPSDALLASLVLEDLNQFDITVDMIDAFPNILTKNLRRLTNPLHSSIITYQIDLEGRRAV